MAIQVVAQAARVGAQATAKGVQVGAKVGAKAAQKGAQATAKAARGTGQAAGKAARGTTKAVGKGARGAKGAGSKAQQGVKQAKDTAKKAKDTAKKADDLRKGGDRQKGHRERRRQSKGEKQEDKKGRLRKAGDRAKAGLANELEAQKGNRSGGGVGLDAADRALDRAGARAGRTARRWRRNAPKEALKSFSLKAQQKRARRLILLPLLLLLLGLFALAVLLPVFGGDDIDPEILAAMAEACQEGGGGVACGRFAAGGTGQVTGMSCREVMSAENRRSGIVFDPVPCAEVFNQAGADLGIDPRLLAAISWKESGFRSELIHCHRSSSAGAQGIMQLMPVTVGDLQSGRLPAFNFGAIDPCDPVSAIPAASTYIKTLGYDKFGDWELALAAYNWGPYALESHLRRNGGTPDWDSMPCETRNYVHGTRCVLNGVLLTGTGIMAKYEEYQMLFPDTGGMPVGGPINALGATDRVQQGSITREMQALLDHIIPRFGRGVELGCYRNDTGAHGSGKACDYALAPTWSGTMPNQQNAAHGHRLAEYLVANADMLNVDCVIWWGRIWRSDRDARGHRSWMDQRAYTSYNNITLDHYDHIHVSVRPRAGHGRC